MTEPEIRIERGNPTPEELAALIIVLTSMATAKKIEHHQTHWANKERLLRPPVARGWRSLTS